MYNVRLNKTALHSGRDFVNNFVLSLKSSDSFPPGTAELLRTFVARAEADWNQYASYFEQDYDHSSIFGIAVQAITNATVACELAAEMHGVLRMEYAPLDREVLTDSHRQFANDTRRLLNLMTGMVERLKSTKVADKVADTKKVDIRLQRLAYAKHVADVAVGVCKPENYSFKHPETEKWLAIRARVKRACATAMTDSARFDEGAAKA